MFYREIWTLSRILENLLYCSEPVANIVCINPFQETLLPQTETAPNTPTALKHLRVSVWKPTVLILGGALCKDKIGGTHVNWRVLFLNFVLWTPLSWNRVSDKHITFTLNCSVEIEIAKRARKKSWRRTHKFEENLQSWFK